MKGMLDVYVVILGGHTVGVGISGAGIYSFNHILHSFGFESKYEYKRFYPDGFTAPSCISKLYFFDVIHEPDYYQLGDWYWIYYNTIPKDTLEGIMKFIEHPREEGMFPLMAVPTSPRQCKDANADVKNFNMVDFWFCSDWKG